MKDFRRLEVWAQGHQLTLAVYRETQKLPGDERFGLTSQIRRASVSIPANIAEGCGRHTNPEFVRFLDIAMGSSSELEYHLLLAHDLGYLDADHYDALNKQLSTTRRMLNALIQKIRHEIADQSSH